MPWLGSPTSYASGYSSAQRTSASSQSLTTEPTSPPTYWTGLRTRGSKGSRAGYSESTGINTGYPNERWFQGRGRDRLPRRAIPRPAWGRGSRADGGCFRRRDNAGYGYDWRAMGGPAERPVVILADDDEAITSNLAPFLDRAGFTVHVASDGEAALDLVQRLDPDGCVLDVLMPRADGREVLRRLRADGRWLPVVLLTQVGESGERAIALDEGADDYLNKPFDPYELLARLRAVLRRSRPGRRPLSASPTLRARDLRMDRISRRAWLRDTELVLTPKAMLLLDYLVTHPDELMTRDRLLEVLWGFDFPVGTRAVDNRIAELRRALGDDPMRPEWIATVPGQGYRFMASVDEVL